MTGTIAAATPTPSPTPSPTPRHPPQVSWFAPFYSSGGYATEARDFVLGLLDSGALAQGRLGALRITQHGDALDERALEGLSDATLAGLAQLRKSQLSPDEAIVICHAEPGAWRPPRYKTSLCPPDEEPAYTVGRTTFETDRIPVEWASRCRSMDEIWVPSAFNRDTFVRGGVPAGRIRIVPEAVDTAFFDPATVETPLALPLGHSLYRPASSDHASSSFFKLPAGWRACELDRSLHNSARGANTGADAGPSPGPGPGPGGFAVVFLSVFKWEARKNWPLLLRAYLQAFANRCDVLLQLVTNPFHLDADLSKTARREMKAAMRELNATTPVMADGLRHAPCVAVLDGHLPSTDMPRLYAAADAFVLPSHGEGWGRPHVEAMAMGVPVVATNWSGVTAYLTSDVGYPVAIEGLVPVEEGPYRRRHRWAQPSLPHLVDVLRHVAANPDEAKEKGRAARQLMVSRFSRPVVADLVLAELRRIQLHLEAEGIV